MSKAVKWVADHSLITSRGRKKMFGGLMPKEPKEPKEVTPEPAPDPDEYEAARAESRRLQRRKRSGRTSTVLTGGSQLG